MRKFFNEKITTRDISKFLNDTTKTQISAGSGLLLIKTTSNSASWQYRYKVKGKRFVYTIGTLNDVDLPTAQAKHKELWQKVANGVNVAVEKQNAKGKVKTNTAIFSLSKLAQFFIKHSENLQADTNYSKNTISLIQRFLIDPKFELFKSKNIENAFNEKISVENFINSPASEITEIDIKNYLNNIKHKTTKQKIANLLLAIYKKAITYKQTTKITTNPAEIVNNKTEIRFAKSERSRLVSDVELKELFNLLSNSKNQTLATATKLLFMLGVRKNELLKAEWSEFNFENNFWTLPAERCKNKKSIKIPLSQPVIKLLKSLQNNQNNQSKFVFNSFHKNNTGAISSAILNIYICNLINNNSIIKEKITPHDARRYVRTTLNKILDGNATEKQFICERVLNHSLQLQGVNTQILNTYLIDDFFKERKQALNKLADYITSITNE